MGCQEVPSRCGQPGPFQPPPSEAVHLHTGHTRHCLHIPPAALLPHLIHVAWIKGDAHFMGDELADYFSKWAAQAFLWHPSLLPPPPPCGSGHQWGPSPHLQNSETSHPLPPPNPPTHAPAFRHQRKLSPTGKLFLGNRIQVGVRHVWLSGLQTSL